jgi:sporulation protein YlmC with PRC-barrel domain
MRLEELRHKPVVSMISDAQLGAVSDFLLDDTYLQISAFVIGGAAGFGSHRLAVPYGAIRGIGAETVIVSGSNAVQEVAYGRPLWNTHPLHGTRPCASNESGSNLGPVVNMEFDPRTGALTSVWLAPPDDSVVRVVARPDIVRITEQMAVIRHAVDDDEFPIAA